ncbi:MAG: hydroxyacid dehydrogenase [Promethearchaeota archaeon]
MISILVADKLPSEALGQFDRGVFNVVEDFTISPEDLLERIPEFDGLVVRSRTKVTREVIGRGEKLKIVVRAGVGLDNVDLDAAKEGGVVVRNTPLAASVSVAEHAMGLMLSMARFIPLANQSMHEGKWLKSKYLGTQLKGKSLGIVGFGRIGEELAKRALVFGMDVGMFDVLPAAAGKAKSMGLRVYGDVDELLQSVDYVSIHVPYLPATHHLINAERLGKMKNNARIVNTSRGRVIDEGALVEALESGEIAGAALDVFYDEPTKNEALFKLENAVLTPHIGSSTRETQQLAAQMVVDEITRFFTSKT